MYHWIFKARLRDAFRNINQGRFDLIVPQFSVQHEHTFYGDHALGGTRNRLEETREWYERLARLFPDLKFEIVDIVSKGWPWDTVAAVEWIDHFTVDGKPMSNQGVHMFRFRWGRCTSLRVYCDTQRLQHVCALKASNGLEEATLAPITSPTAQER